jgi:hypothetical protein
LGRGTAGLKWKDQYIDVDIIGKLEGRERKEETGRGRGGEEGGEGRG